MKKVVFIIVCILNINVVRANTLEYEYLPYEVVVNNEVIKIKKVVDNNGDAVFSLDFNHYDISNNFNKYSEINRSNYGLKYTNVNFFNTIVYYGYNLNKTELNYFLTQVIIWELINGYNVEIDTEYEKAHDLLWNTIINHQVDNKFYYKKYNNEIWDTLTFNYGNNIVLEPTDIEGLDMYLEDNNLIISNNSVGNYKIYLNKTYDHLNYCYNDGKNFYWQNLGGPENISKYIYYNVAGINFNIKENLHGVNNLFGDASLKSSYELYLDNELKLTITNLSDYYIKSNSSYVLKDTSVSTGIYHIEDIMFNSLEEDLEIIIDKYVISKNISINILDDNTYYIYLKSNNELYEVINKDSDLITLPYGIYYITDKNSYYQELEVLNNIDEILEIESNKEEVEEEISNNEIVEVEEITTIDMKVENPKTLDNIYLYILLFIFNSFLLFVGCYCIRGLK